MTLKSRELFDANDEREFKRSFVVQFMAALEAVHYAGNCHRGWEGHRIAVEDAAYMADKAWDEWVETMGVKSNDTKATSE